MTVGRFLKEASAQLSDAGIATARLDVLVLLEDVLSTDRAQLLAHPESELSEAQTKTLQSKVTRRSTHEPLAYIRGNVPFFGREFFVDKRTLVPRPESETIIELLKECPLPHDPAVLDVGTGSGCLGITAALELPKSHVTLSDISADALAIAKRNAAALHASNITLAQADLAELCQTQAFDAVLANLPYVPEHFEVNRAARFEPKLALFAGADGLDAYKKFWQQLAVAKAKPAVVLTESLPFQHHANAQLARQASYILTQKEGLVQAFLIDAR